MCNSNSQKAGKKLNILVIGAGMYVCGRGTDGYGTILPSILEWSKTNSLGDVYITGSSSEGIEVAKRKIGELQRNVGVKASIRYFPEGKAKDKKCYKKAIQAISKPACAIIVVPDNLHKEIAISAIENRLHTLVAKPLAPTLKEVRKLIEIQRRNKVYCAVEFHKRLDYANLKLRDAISHGSIGDPLYFLVEYSQRRSVPSERFKKWVETTSVFQYLGIHYIDVIYFATNAKPVRGMAIGQKGWLASKKINAYDSIEAVIEWEMPQGKRFVSHILTNWVDPESTSAMSNQKIKVIGTKGRLESDQKKRGITVVTEAGGTEEPNPYFCSAYGRKGEVLYKGYGIDSVCQFLDDVLQIEEGKLRIENLEDKRPTFKEFLVSSVVLEAINKSLKNDGKWVTIDG